MDFSKFESGIKITSEEGYKDRYYTYIAGQKVEQALRVPDTHIFAFQEMNIESGAVQNDKAIFGSVTSLMKAQAYELDSLPQRLKSKRVYQFNLVSVVQSDLIKLHFEGDSITGSQVDQEHYVSRYIINGEETFAHIHFIQESAFAEVVKDYDRLHNANCSFFNDEYDRFFLDAAKNYKKSELFKDELSREMRICLFQNLASGYYRLIKETISVSWSESEGILYIELGFDLDKAVLESLNNDRKLSDEAGRALKKLYRYEGSFKFTDGWIPF